MQRAPVYSIQPAIFAEIVIFPALTAIGLYSPAAEELVLGTALQESGLLYLHQQGGPALGFFQMEPATHDDIWANFIEPDDILYQEMNGLIARVGGLTLEQDRLNQLVGNAFYAAAMCRLLYRRVAEPLPAAGDLAGQAAYYKAHYNTPEGAATEAEYIANWLAAFPIKGAAS
jgi:hypothetical protein